MTIAGNALAWLRNRRNPRVAATGIIVGRKVECEESAYAVLIDLHYEYEGRSYQSQARVAVFADAERARSALAHWPIGSFQPLTFVAGSPEYVSVA
jgi:hypothetical protein